MLSNIIDMSPAQETIRQKYGERYVFEENATKEVAALWVTCGWESRFIYQSHMLIPLPLYLYEQIENIFRGLDISFL